MSNNTGDQFDHAGITVPNLEEAVGFFVDDLGFELWYYEGPFEDPDGDSMAEELVVEPRAWLNCAMLRSVSGAKLELLEYRVPGKAPTSPPRNSDHSAAHLAFRVSDIDAVVQRLASRPGVTVAKGPATVTGGRSDGLRWIYCTAPWGLQLELVQLPPQLLSSAEAGDGRD